MKNKDTLSLGSNSLRYKLRISVYLMSILPLLVCIYLISNYVLPKLGFELDIIVSMLISIFISGIGFYLIKGIFDRILSVTNEAKLIAAGDINRRLQVKGQDEIGDLGNALNKLTERIRNNIDELNNYSQRTQEIDFEIKKRLFILSALLQISSLISQGAKFEEILKLTIEKARLLANSSIAYIFFKKDSTGDFFIKVADGLNSEYLLQIKITQGEPVFHKLITTGKPLIVDKDNVAAPDTKKEFYEKFRMRSCLALPVFLKGEVVGILGIANTEEAFLYKKDDKELLDILAKQVAIALEHDLLAHRLDKLEIKDPLTGLFNEKFIRNRLEEEIKRAIAYQRPCAFVLLEIDDFDAFQRNFGILYAENTLKKTAFLIRDSVTEIDRVARTVDNRFAIVLPERNKRQAQLIATDIKRKIEFVFSEEKDNNKRLSVNMAVSENPLDGIDSKELIEKAQEALHTAKPEGYDNIL